MPVKSIKIPSIVHPRIMIVFEEQSISSSLIRIRFEIKESDIVAPGKCTSNGDQPAKSQEPQFSNFPIVQTVERYLQGNKITWQEDIIDHCIENGFSTPFQRNVALALIHTSAGETITYGNLARTAGHPGAARAVGGVMRSNPFPLIIPCHRVVSCDGLGGFAGNEHAELLELKRALLVHESRMGA